MIIIVQDRYKLVALLGELNKKFHPIPHPFRPFLCSAPPHPYRFLPLPRPSPEGVTAIYVRIVLFMCIN